MNAFSRTNWRGRLLVFFVLQLLVAPTFVMAGSARTFCSAMQGAWGATNGAAAQNLADLARRAEAAVASDDDPVVVARLDRLDLDFASAGGASPEARAAFCSAIGELARRGRLGSTLDAPGYLYIAFAEAELGTDRDVSARAAYRLGLALAATSAAISGGRERARGGPDPSTMIEMDLIGQPRGSAACEALRGFPNLIDALRHATASQALACAAERASESGNKGLAALSGLRLARLLTNAARLLPVHADEMRSTAGTVAIERLDALKDDPSSEITLRLIETSVDAGRTQDPVLAAAIKTAEETTPASPHLRGYALALHGRLLLASGRRDLALPLIRGAIFLESQSPLPSRLPEWYLLLAAAEPDRRTQHVTTAYAVLEEIRASLRLRDELTEESVLDLRMRAVFEAAIDQSLSRLPIEGAHDPNALRGRARSAAFASTQGIMENYREAEIRNALGTECLPASKPFQAKALRADEVVLYPIMLEDRLELLYLRGDAGHEFHRLPPNRTLSREDMAALVGSLRWSITQKLGDWQPASQRLNQILIMPISHALRPDTTLIIIPDALLSGLPFATLQDEHDHRFLIERTRLVISPGLAWAHPGASRTGRSAYVVAGSLDHAVQLQFGRFSRLNNAAAEAKFAAGSEGGDGSTRGLYLKDFTRESLTKALNSHRVDVLHLATHASFSGGTDKSFIVANGDFISLEDLRDILGRNRAFGNELDLLVLSACETAVGDDRSSLGLAGAAVESGARGAIASLWSVNDRTTAQLMRDFYIAYRNGAAKAEAVRSAQVAMLSAPPRVGPDGGAIDFRHPYYWGPLILVGGWR